MDFCSPETRNVAAGTHGTKTKINIRGIHWDQIIRGKTNNWKH